MEELFDRLLAELKSGKSVVLAVVAEGDGSAPRGAGAFMLVGAEGRLCGTVGGGSLEYQAIAAAQDQLLRRENRVESFGLAPSAPLGMACGGQVKLTFCWLNPARDLETIAELTERMRQHKPCWLLVPMGEGALQLRERVEPVSGGLHGVLALDGVPYYAERLCYDGVVYLLGGGHLGQETAALLSHVGFRCVVADDREEYADPKLFPAAERVLRVDFNRLEESLHVEQNDYIAIMTRGHACDRECERFALRTSAAYIGVVGSARKTAYVRAQLMREGFTEAELNRITTPIGLKIGSETPAEIAVSIAAQLIAFRAEKYR